MSEAGQERKMLEPVTEDQVVEAGERLTSKYPNVFWLVDFEGVLLPKSFKSLGEKSITFDHADDLTAIEKGIYKLPANQTLIQLLERLLSTDPERNWLVEGSSLVSVPEAEIQRHIPAFRFGIQRSRELLSNLAEKTVGERKSIKPGSMPQGSLMIVLNDEMPPLGLYKHIKARSPGSYDSYDICEVPLDVYRGRESGDNRQATLDALYRSFNAPVIKRPVELSKTTTWSSGSGLASMAPSGMRIRREGD